MIIEIPDFYLGLITGIIITIIFLAMVGLWLNREQTPKDVYHPLNRKKGE